DVDRPGEDARLGEPRSARRAEAHLVLTGGAGITGDQMPVPELRRCSSAAIRSARATPTRRQTRWTYPPPHVDSRRASVAATVGFCTAARPSPGPGRDSAPAV